MDVGPTEREYATTVTGGPIVGYSDALCVYDKDVADRLMGIATARGLSPQPRRWVPSCRCLALQGQRADAARGTALPADVEHPWFGSSAVIRLGIPMELDPDVLPMALAKFAVESPNTRVVPQHLSTAAQIKALRSDRLDVGLVRERPSGSEFDAMLVAQEPLGVLISSKVVARLADSDGLQLDQLAELKWLGFPRASSPAWYDELTGILRSHGIDVGPRAADDQVLIAAVKFVAVGSGQTFALAPEHGLQPLPDNVTLVAVGR